MLHERNARQNRRFTMAWLDETLGGWGTTVLTGIVATVAVPVLLPVIGSILRPVVKEAIKAGLTLADTLQESVAEGREQLDDLLAEVRAERAMSARQKMPHATTNGGTTER
jgi:hypothetical protein